MKPARSLAQEGVANFRVIFIMAGMESKLSCKLKEDAERSKLPIEFAGVLKRDELFGWHARAALLFPSCLESFGLPLLEAKMHSAPVVAADTPFGRGMKVPHSTLANALMAIIGHRMHGEGNWPHSQYP